MNDFDPAQLALFTGTERYYRITRRCLLTDVTKYLADAAGAYWLMVFGVFFKSLQSF